MATHTITEIIEANILSTSGTGYNSYSTSSALSTPVTVLRFTGSGTQYQNDSVNPWGASLTVQGLQNSVWVSLISTSIGSAAIDKPCNWSGSWDLNTADVTQIRMMTSCGTNYGTWSGVISKYSIDHALTESVNPANSGTVAVEQVGNTVTLTATSNSGYTFLNWVDANQQVYTDNPLSLTVTGDITLVANFEDIKYNIVAQSSDINKGTVIGGGLYTVNSTATLIATPLPDYLFVNWTEYGVVVSSNSTYSFTVTGNRNLTANFIQDTNIKNVILKDGDCKLYPKIYTRNIVGLNSSNLVTKTLDTQLKYLTTAPTEDNSVGLKIVVLDEEPAVRYNGYLYIVTATESTDSII